VTIFETFKNSTQYFTCIIGANVKFYLKDFFLAQMKYQLAQKQGVDFNTITF